MTSHPFCNSCCVILCCHNSQIHLYCRVKFIYWQSDTFIVITPRYAFTVEWNLRLKRPKKLRYPVTSHPFCNSCCVILCRHNSQIHLYRRVKFIYWRSHTFIVITPRSAFTVEKNLRLKRPKKLRYPVTSHPFCNSCCVNLCCHNSQIHSYCRVKFFYWQSHTFIVITPRSAFTVE